MDLNTITEVARPKTRDQLPVWTAGDAWLAGGTWLFSEPNVDLKRLVDLADLDWPALTISEAGLSIAATCTVAQLDALTCPPEWIASPLINQCCRAFLASFKIWKTATVGGNICMSLPAGPMISLTSALDGVATIWQRERRRTENSDCRLRDGQQPERAHARRSRAADRHSARSPETALGVSSDLVDGDRPFRRMLIGSVAGDGAFLLTVTASTIRPVKFSFAEIPTAEDLHRTILQRIPDSLYHTDIHGKPEWRKYMTLRFAEEIRGELQARP